MYPGLDLHGISGALMATSNMQMQTFLTGEPVAFAANQRDEVRDLHDVAGALGAQPGMKQQTFVAEGCLTPWDTQQQRVFTPEGKAPTLAGADGGGGRNPAGLLFTAGFCARAAPTAGGIGWQEECSPTLKAAESGTNMVPSILCLNDQGGQRMDIAMDIMAKRVPPDRDGVRIAKLSEMTYRRLLWSHRPLTDFWRVGRGYAKKLEEHGLYTMGDIARCSIGKPTDYHNEELLYKLFGVNAELLIDHAWGWEPCTIADVKAYKPESSSIGAGQVLQTPYTFDKARLVAREMADSLSLDLVDKGLVTDQIVLTVGYDRENLTDPQRSRAYKGPVTTDHYGRRIPKHAHGTANLGRYSSSTSEMVRAAMELFDRIVDKDLLVQRLNIVAGRVISEDAVPKQAAAEQLDLFTDYEAREKQQEADAAALKKEKEIQRTMLDIKKKYGKNAILKGMDLQEGATARERNQTIGGHQE